MAMGKRKRRTRQTSMWIASSDLPITAAHPFYDRLNRILDDEGFDAFVEAQSAPFYADTLGRPGLAPGRYFPLLLVGYFEGLDSADSSALRHFLGLELPEAPPDHSTLSPCAPNNRSGDPSGGVHVNPATPSRCPARARSDH